MCLDSRTDIDDISVFQSPSNANNTVLIMTVNPAAGILSPDTFYPRSRFEFLGDNNGDVREDIRFSFRFGPPNDMDVQDIRLQTNGAALPNIQGQTKTDISLPGGGLLRAGKFDDPFFFNLIAFRSLSFFTPTPADAKDFFRGRPEDDVADFFDMVVATLTSLGASGPTSLASGLLPDILTVDTSSSAGFIKGRQLANDVIDGEIGLVTNGAITTDCVDANDRAFSTSFPEFAPPNP